MATKNTKYTFDSFETNNHTTTKRKHHNHRRHNSHDNSSNNDGDDPTDGNGSLTYSAASSINSAGESTDSSFADIMKVLDGQDTHELAAYLKHQAAKQHHNNNINNHTSRDERSVGESLAYSTDAESHMQRSMGTDAHTDASGLHGTDLLSTITGQASDQLFDGGGANGATREGPGTGDADADADLDIMFSPAEHTDSLKRRKDKKRRNKLNSGSNNGTPTSSSGGSGSRKAASPPDAVSTPRVKNSNGNRTQYGSPQQQSPNQQYSSPLQRSGSSRNSNTPPSSTSAQRRPPKAGDNSNAGNYNGNHSNMNMETPEEDDVWYAKWWMFCFPDTVQNMSPKR